MFKLIAYQINADDVAPIRPARRERKWMEDTDQRFVYRCLPLVVANQFGWEILCTHHVRITWDGSSRPEGIYVENLYGDGRLHCNSHFGAGVVSFLIPYLFRTPKDWNLLVRGPANSPKDGIAALEGIVETDWAYSTFTMNWRFTRACTVEFVVGEPICLIYPIQRGLLEMFEGEICMLATDPDLQKRYEEWSVSRERFLNGLRDKEPEAIKQGWQKDYSVSSKEKRPPISEFRRTIIHH